MIVIRTKETRDGNWTCYATFIGTDYSYSAFFMEDAQLMMAECLLRRKIELKNQKWLNPTKYRKRDPLKRSAKTILDKKTFS